VIQYIYQRYGRHRARYAHRGALRSRRAIREVGKVLGLTEDVTAALARPYGVMATACRTIISAKPASTRTIRRSAKPSTLR